VVMKDPDGLAVRRHEHLQAALKVGSERLTAEVKYVVLGLVAVLAT